jgi:holo-[acyl-carrier protein] synthase
MVEGIGIDVVEIDRMHRTIGQWGDVFLRKILTDQEIAYASSKRTPVPHIAGRFAVKEAVAKALTIGWSTGFRWKDVEVTNDPRGKPTVILYGRLKEMLQDSKVLVSISHSDNVVVAIAIIEKKERDVAFRE